MRRLAAVVLAAGTASRYRAAGGREATKLLEAVRGEPMLRRPVRAALEAGCDPVVVVTGHARAEVQGALGDLPIRFVHNPDYAAGLAGSLRTGLQALGPEIEGAVILLGDMPLIDAAVIGRLSAEAGQQPDAQAIVPVFDGERGNPVLLRRELFAAAARLSGDEGARRLLRDPALHVREVSFIDAAVRLDIDEPGGFAV